MDYHDALAELGIGSAHPGGFRMTLAWLDRVDLAHCRDVLEVGCGTGRTACQIAQRYKSRVTGVDIRGSMIAKARRRADAVGASVQFLQVKTGRLPFLDGSFDAVVAESVTVFNPVRRMVGEYARVLRGGGVFVDTEMCAAGPLPPDVRNDFRRVYGAVEVPTLRGWKDLLSEAGLSGVHVLLSGPLQSLMLQDDVKDDQAEPEQSSVGKEIAALLQANGELMARHGPWLHYAVLVAYAT